MHQLHHFQLFSNDSYFIGSILCLESGMTLLRIRGPDMKERYSNIDLTEKSYTTMTRKRLSHLYLATKEM